MHIATGNNVVETRFYLTKLDDRQLAFVGELLARQLAPEAPLMAGRLGDAVADELERRVYGRMGDPREAMPLTVPLNLPVVEYARAYRFFDALERALPGTPGGAMAQVLRCICGTFLSARAERGNDGQQTMV
jgi:hypothetical protein